MCCGFALKKVKVIKLGYLKCDKCGKYYELQKEESLEDFEKCDCGGHLTFTEQIDQPETRKGNIKVKPNVLESKIISVGIGTIIMLIPYLLFSGPSVFGQGLSFILWVIGGFIASFILGGKLKNGVLNGFLVAFLSGIVAIIFLLVPLNLLVNPLIGFNMATDFGILLGGAIMYIFVTAVFSVIGGILGVYSRSKLNKHIS